VFEPRAHQGSEHTKTKQRNRSPSFVVHDRILGERSFIIERSRTTFLRSPQNRPPSEAVIVRQSAFQGVAIGRSLVFMTLLQQGVSH
jgi:hypothetical protein